MGEGHPLNPEGRLKGGGGEVGGDGIGHGRSTVGSGTEGKRVGSSKGKRGSG